jgi:hypothetical protein
VGAARHVARALLCAGRLEWDRLDRQVSVASYDPIPHPDGSNSPLLEATIGRTVPDLTSFDPDLWTWWRDGPRNAHPIESLTIHLIVPGSVDGIDRSLVPATVRTRHPDGVRVELHRAAVETAHVLTIQTLEDDWVRDLRRGAIASLDDWIRTDGGLSREEWGVSA